MRLLIAFHTSYKMAGEMLVYMPIGKRWKKRFKITHSFSVPSLISVKRVLLINLHTKELQLWASSLPFILPAPVLFQNCLYNFSNWNLKLLMYLPITWIVRKSGVCDGVNSINFYWLHTPCSCMNHIMLYDPNEAVNLWPYLLLADRRKSVGLFVL